MTVRDGLNRGLWLDEDFRRPPDRAGRALIVTVWLAVWVLGVVLLSAVAAVAWLVARWLLGVLG